MSRVTLSVAAWTVELTISSAERGKGCRSYARQRNWRIKIFAVAIWPVTGQGFQNTKWPAVLYSQ